MAQTGFTPILLYSSSTTTNAPAAGSLINSTLGSELAINIADGKLFYKDNSNNVQVIAWKTTPTTAGGTGLTSYTAGDLLYYATGTILSKLAIGATGYWLGSSGTAPQWNAPAALTKTDDTNVTLTLGGSASTALLNAASLTLGWTGQLAVTRGGTGLSTVAQGDILYGSASNTLAVLAKNTTATRYLSNTGSSNNPAWAQIDLTNGVTGTLPVGNGGTGTATAFTAGSVVFAGASGVYTQDNANLFWDDTNNRLGVGTASPATVFHTQIGASDYFRYGSNPRAYLLCATGFNGLRIDADATPLEIRTLTTGGPTINVAGGTNNLTITAASATAGTTTRNSPTLFFTGNYWTGSANATAFQGSIYAKVTSAASNGGGLSLGGSGGSDHVFIAASTGNTGVGTTSPRAKLDVNGGLFLAAGNQIQITGNSGSNGLQLIGQDSAESIIGTMSGQPLVFRTGSTERARFTDGGEFYVAGTTDQGAYNIQCNGTGVWGAGAYVNGSDQRIKNDIEPLDSGLDVVAKLNPVTYKYKENWSKDQSTQTGFIAQELLTALEGKNYVDGVVQQGGQYMSVAYQNIIPILTKAIQEQQFLIENLTTRLNVLEGN